MGDDIANPLLLEKKMVPVNIEKPVLHSEDHHIIDKATGVEARIRSLVKGGELMLQLADERGCTEAVVQLAERTALEMMNYNSNNPCKPKQPTSTCNVVYHEMLMTSKKGRSASRPRGNPSCPPRFATAPRSASMPPPQRLGNRVPWQPTPAPAQPAGSPADAEAEASADLVHYGGPSAGSDGSGGGGPGGGGGEGGRLSRWRRRRCASGKAPDVRAHNSGVPGL